MLSVIFLSESKTRFCPGPTERTDGRHVPCGAPNRPHIWRYPATVARNTWCSTAIGYLSKKVKKTPTSCQWWLYLSIVAMHNCFQWLIYPCLVCLPALNLSWQQKDPGSPYSNRKRFPSILDSRYARCWNIEPPNGGKWSVVLSLSLKT